MKEHPLLYSAPMAIANVEDRKSQTRRIISPQPPDGYLHGVTVSASTDKDDVGKHVWYDRIPNPNHGHRVRCRWNTGDRIWQKETFFHIGNRRLHDPAFAGTTVDNLYFADYAYRDKDRRVIGNHHWTPSIFMPRASSRFTAEIVEVRAQRLQDITSEDAEAEGALDFNRNDSEPPIGFRPDGTLGPCYFSAIGSYRNLWNSIHLKPSPVYGPKDKATGRRPIIAYVSHPWSIEDFDASHYQGAHASGVHNNKPIHIIPNPWVWAISYRKIVNPEA